MDRNSYKYFSSFVSLLIHSLRINLHLILLRSTHSFPFEKDFVVSINIHFVILSRYILFIERGKKTAQMNVLMWQLKRLISFDDDDYRSGGSDFFHFIRFHMTIRKKMLFLFYQLSIWRLTAITQFRLADHRKLLMVSFMSFCFPIVVYMNFVKSKQTLRVKLSILLCPHVMSAICSLKISSTCFSLLIQM